MVIAAIRSCLAMVSISVITIILLLVFEVITEIRLCLLSLGCDCH